MNQPPTIKMYPKEDNLVLAHIIEQDHPECVITKLHHTREFRY